jgi:hypothetical protein
MDLAGVILGWHVGSQRPKLGIPARLRYLFVLEELRSERLPTVYLLVTVRR